MHRSFKNCRGFCKSFKRRTAATGTWCTAIVAVRSCTSPCRIRCTVPTTPQDTRWYRSLQMRTSSPARIGPSGPATMGPSGASAGGGKGGGPSGPSAGGGKAGRSAPPVLLSPWAFFKNLAALKPMIFKAFFSFFDFFTAFGFTSDFESKTKFSPRLRFPESKPAQGTPHGGSGRH